jgi:hypothetical protein
MMQERPRRARGRDRRMVERAVVLQVLRDDHEECWSRVELADEVSDFETAVLELALARLEGDGVVRLEDGRVAASRAARRLDELGLICV